MNEKQMSSEESLRLIENMIQKVKKDLDDDSFYFLFWGWLVFASAIAHYLLLNQNDINPSVVWLTMPAGGVITFLYAMRDKKKQPKAQTYVNSFLKYVMMAFLASMCIVLFSQFQLKSNTYPMLMMVYGCMLFINGGVIQFKPLVWGGVANWAIAVVSMYVLFDVQLLLLAAAVLTGFIIPGHLLKRHYKQQMQFAS